MAKGEAPRVKQRGDSGPPGTFQAFVARTIAPQRFTVPRA
jgi:hypothetical protein